MTAIVPTDRARALQLVAEIRQGLEEFYHTGVKLAQLNDPRMYRALGYETFEECCKVEFDWTRQRAYQLIQAAEYRAILPDVNPGLTSNGATWTEKAVRELTRFEDKRDAKRVATKALKAIEESQKAAVKDPTIKPMRLSGPTMKKFVDADMGIDHKKQAKERRQKEEEDSHPKPERFLDDMTGRLEAEIELLQPLMDSDVEMKLLKKEHPGTVKRFIEVCSALADLVRRFGR